MHVGDQKVFQELSRLLNFSFQLSKQKISGDEVYIIQHIGNESETTNILIIFFPWWPTI